MVKKKRKNEKGEDEVGEEKTGTARNVLPSKFMLQVHI